MSTYSKPDNLDVESEQAFEAHAAMVTAKAAKPELSTNPFWTALRDTAFARFRNHYEKGAPNGR